MKQATFNFSNKLPAGGHNYPLKCGEQATPPEKKRTAKDMILERLAKSPVPLAIHELQIKEYSENNLATGLPELAVEKK